MMVFDAPAEFITSGGIEVPAEFITSTGGIEVPAEFSPFLLLQHTLRVASVTGQSGSWGSIPSPDIPMCICLSDQGQGRAPANALH